MYCQLIGVSFFPLLSYCVCRLWWTSRWVLCREERANEVASWQDCWGDKVSIIITLLYLAITPKMIIRASYHTFVTVAIVKINASS
jgi:hypothetical protein